ncbi:MAG: WD40 repeat domain-containing protein [Pyrinomonadaceae bacterium]
MKFLTFILLMVIPVGGVTSAFSQRPQTVPKKEFAHVLGALPEFRDISAWKGRTGLTLFSPDGKYLAVSGKKADVVIYESATRREVCAIDGKGFEAFSFSPDSKFAVVQNSSDGSIEIFEVESGKSVRQIRGLGKVSNFTKTVGGAGMVNEAWGIYPLAVLEMGRVPVTPDWKSILVNKNDKEFSLYDFQSGELKVNLDHSKYNAAWENTKVALSVLAVLGGSPAALNLLGSTSNTQFSNDGKYLLIANGNKNPSLWNLAKGELLTKFDAGAQVFYARFSPDSKMVATSDFHGYTKIWDTATGDTISTIGDKDDRGIVLGWSSDSSVIFVNPRREDDLRSYDSRTGKMVNRFEGSNPNGSFLRPDSQIAITAPRGNKTVLFQIWDAESAKLLVTVPRAKGQHAIISLKWSPDGEVIATAEGTDKNIKLWDLKGDLLQTLAFSCMPMNFSRDGKYLVTGGKLNDGKTDTGYVWEFGSETSEDKLALLR